MCGDSGISAAVPRFDDSDSIDDLIDEEEYPGLATKLRSHRIYTIGDLRERGVQRSLPEWVGESRAGAIREMMYDNDGREP